MRAPIDVPLCKLKPDPANVRKTDMAPSPQLVASIREEGVIEPLIVRESGDFYYVTSGGKRHAALTILLQEGAIEPQHPVRCLLLDGDERTARNIGLVVNYMRDDMHPVDEFEAFAELVTDGLTPDQIARKYGLTLRDVGQVLALGKLAPDIRAAWRDDQLNAEAAKAFTLEPDQKRQASVFATLKKRGTLHAWSIRTAILGEERQAEAMVAFVGLEAYQAAGGATAEDLFADPTMPSAVATDLKLLKRLHDEKLQQKLEELKAEGWQWVAFESDLPVSAPWWNGRPRNQIKAADRDKFGVIIAKGHNGCVQIKYGVEKPAAAKASKQAAAKGEGGEAAISAALCGRLSRQVTQAAAAVLANDPPLAAAALAAALTCCEGPVCIDRKLTAANEDDEDKDSDNEFGRQLALFRRKTPADLSKAIAELVARSLDLGGATLNSLPLAEDREADRALLEALDPKKLNAELRAHFDADDYFAGVAAKACKDTIALCDPKYPFTGREKKSELAKLAAELARKSNAGGKAGYLPPEMRTAHYDGPRPKASAKPAAKAKAGAKAKTKAKATPAKKKIT